MGFFSLKKLYLFVHMKVFLVKVQIVVHKWMNEQQGGKKIREKEGKSLCF